MDYSRYFSVGIYKKLIVELFYVDIMLGRKWKPKYFTVQDESKLVTFDPTQQLDLDEGMKDEILPRKKQKKKQELSTKGVLNDYEFCLRS